MIKDYATLHVLLTPLPPYELCHLTQNSGAANPWHHQLLKRSLRHASCFSSLVKKITDSPTMWSLASNC